MGVRNTRQILGLEYFDAASKEDLQVIWEKMSNRAGYCVVKAMLGPTFAVIDLEKIIDGPQSAEIRAVRLALRYMLTLGA